MQKHVTCFRIVLTILWMTTALARGQTGLPRPAPGTLTGALRSMAANDARFRPALAAAEINDFETVYRVMADLLREHPRDESVNFAFGLAAVRRGRPSLGVLAFERVLTLNPENGRARLELARTYFAIGQFHQSRHHFEQALVRNPPPQVRESINGYLRHIKRHRPGWRSHGRIEFGALYDNNINYGPDKRTIEIAPLTIGPFRFDELRVDDDTARQSAAGGLVSLTLRPSYKSFAPGGWYFDSQINGYANYLADAEDFNIAGFQAGGGPRYHRDRHGVYLPLRAEHLWRGGTSLATIFGIYPRHDYQANPALSFAGNVAIEYRDFTTGSSRNCLLAGIGEQLRYRFGASLQHQAVLGIQVAREFADNDIVRNTKAESTARIAMQMPQRFSFSAGAMARYRAFDEREPLAPRKRRDVQWGLLSGIGRRWTSGWGTDISVQYTENDSSFDLYDYSRYVINWSVAYEF